MRMGVGDTVGGGEDEGGQEKQDSNGPLGTAVHGLLTSLCIQEGPSCLREVHRGGVISLRPPGP